VYAIRQIIEDPQEAIPIPQELHHRRMEVIFIALDSEPEQPSVQPSVASTLTTFN
jgi:hypothetical protein